MRPQYRKHRFMADHDLVALWEAHCRYEFETRDVDATMATMSSHPVRTNCVANKRKDFKDGHYTFGASSRRPDPGYGAV